MGLAHYLDKGASLGPGEACLVSDRITMTYQEVVALSCRVARALGRAGVGPGDKVAILSPNDPTAYTCVYGIARAGAVWCPINPRNEMAENRELLSLFDCTALIFAGDFADLVDEIRPGLPGLKIVVCLDAPHPGAVTFADWVADVPETDPGIAGDGTAAVVGTGGTTGRPKGVQVTDANLDIMAATALMSFPFGDRPRYLAVAPLTHAAGVLVLPIFALGGQVIIMRRPDVGEFLALAERHRVTHTYMPPTLIYRVLNHPALPDTDLGSLRCFWYGSAPITPERLAEAVERIGPMGQFFGQVEAPLMVSVLPPDEHRRPDGSLAVERFSTAGRPTPTTTVGIMDEDGELLPAGERGEIVVRGPLVMAGYYRDPAATAEASRFGWHHTGDLGFFDADGYLRLVDRAKDMIISGGFNVYSAEVERAVMSHPAVHEAAVLGLPDADWGERVVAVVELVPGATLTPAEVIAHARSRLGGVKTPKQVEIWPALPRSTVGKVLKAEIRASLL
jgi:fatty-acyl-CoA synthase